MRYKGDTRQANLPHLDEDAMEHSVELTVGGGPQTLE